jgi:RNA polymerase sigma-70 factor (ECF subfamily)
MQSRFVTTSWTQVLASREAPSSESRQALEGLCKAYWYPLYAFVRRQGNPPEESRDLTQAYFAQLLEKVYLEDFDPSLGRFRVFLKASVKNFLSKERDKSHASKRGGQASILSLSADEVEGRYRFEPVDQLTPEEVFERRWALTLLERVMERLKVEMTGATRGEEFEKLRGSLTGEGAQSPLPPGGPRAPDYGRSGEDLGTPSQAAVRDPSPAGDRGDGLEAGGDRRRGPAPSEEGRLGSVNFPRDPSARGWLKPIFSLV